MTVLECADALGGDTVNELDIEAELVLKLAPGTDDGEESESEAMHRQRFSTDRLGHDALPTLERRR